VAGGQLQREQTGATLFEHLGEAIWGEREREREKTMCGYIDWHLVSWLNEFISELWYDVGMAADKIHVRHCMLFFFNLGKSAAKVKRTIDEAYGV